VSIFPFTIKAYETGYGWTSFDRDFESEWHKVRPKAERFSWYAYDVKVHSPTSVTFIVYDMRDSVYGGIGDKVGEFDATVPTALTRKTILREVMAMAKDRRTQELFKLEQEMIRVYAEQVLYENQLKHLLANADIIRYQEREGI
jgi:hypothetical protein